jgi:hypothetical protein
MGSTPGTIKPSNNNQTYNDIFHTNYAKRNQAEQSSKSVNQTNLTHPAERWRDFLLSYSMFIEQPLPAGTNDYYV